MIHDVGACAQSRSAEETKATLHLTLYMRGFQRRGNGKNCPRHFMTLSHHWRREFVSGSCVLGTRKFPQKFVSGWDFSITNVYNSRDSAVTYFALIYFYII